jgi:hypothetical protein
MMAKKLAIILAILMVIVALWGLFFENNAITILINGQEVSGPLKGIISAGGIVIALIALISLAILLAFAFAGAWIIFLGCIVVCSVVFVVFMFPFLLPLIIPLTLIWVFIAISDQKR